MLPVVLGFILDLIIGDPFGSFHPICAIGNTISFFKKKIRAFFPSNRVGELIGGIILCFIVVFLSTIVPFLLLFVGYRIHFNLGFVIETIFCYQILATKSLRTESMKVYDALSDPDLEKARHAVSMIVGRDTSALSKEGIIKASVETVAENTTDGVIAPLFFMMIGGPVFGFFYKAVNTLDSMVGYKNEENLYFGRMSAKLDDVLNFIPARISALLMIAASFLCGYDAKNAWYIFKRDRLKHASPNSAQTESVCAGALNIQLAGNAYYFGKLYEKKTIGDAKKDLEPLDIKRVNRLMYVTAYLGVLVFCVMILILYIQ
ncbi:adenosylcobinamide-phosphate synthase CbiB [Candidatus Galacturonibacter soehngenii]|uniref:Cobalamin biosynthesis protein CobD n=1 Tax=Candidatus Galacturonatibacter soehngenii TaxID=2307010 RepID=A0A7V7QMI5_9FIRM|nr:adenosylcobinamide-phosphate synthase CbiB [Candidatus Galacturonibacter soehngenii]KAB1439891.1 cobalamin biosynthesis protein CobD [Candidatus Galacturonibacter soehngenii]